MQGSVRRNYRQELEEGLLPFRLARKRKGKPRSGWLRGIREAVGIPVDEVARRLGVCRWEIRRLEKSEENRRIQLATLQRAAEGLGCELVYALVPKEGTLEEMAAAQDGMRAEALAKRRAERDEGKEALAQFVGMRESYLAAMQTMLRREGYRVRPRKTDRGDEQKMAEFERNIRVMKMAGMLGPFMREFLREQAEGRGKDGVAEGSGGYWDLHPKALSMSALG